MEHKIIVRPNHSLARKDALKLLLVIATVAFTIAMGFVVAGAWLVLPFAGLEVLAFFVAFYYIYLHAEDFESITLEEDSVIVEKRGHKIDETVIFQRYWAKVMLREKLDGTRGLFIGSHGKEIEFGRHLISDDQRVQLAKQLKTQLAHFV